MSAFAGIKTATSYGAGQYFQGMPCEKDANGKDIGLAAEAWYRVEVVALKLFQSEDPKKGKPWLFVAECTVLATNHPNVPAGAKRSWMMNMSKTPALGNVKGFVMGLLPEINEEDIDETAMMELVNPETQPAAGVILETRCWGKLSQENRPYTKHVWTPDESGANVAPATPPA